MDNIKDKIAKLLALAQSPEPEEAKEAFLRTRELMAKHKLRPEECQKTENIKVVKEFVDVECTKMTDTWAVTLSAIIAEHYCCTAHHGKNTERKRRA